MITRVGVVYHIELARRAVVIGCVRSVFGYPFENGAKGVSCGIYMSYQGNLEEANAVATNQNDPAKKDITSTTMLRMVLDYADSGFSTTPSVACKRD